MKKSLAIVALLATSFTLTACGSTEKPNQEKPTNTGSVQQTPKEEKIDKITNGMIVSINYTTRIADEKGDVTREKYVKDCSQYKVVDTSYEDVAKACGMYATGTKDYTKSHSFVMGQNTSLKGFEKAVLNKRKGDTITAKITPVNAYGETKKELIKEYDNKMMTGKKDANGNIVEYKIGDTINNTHNQIGKITRITDTKTTVDRNHQYAGKEIIANITIIDIKR